MRLIENLARIVSDFRRKQELPKQSVHVEFPVLAPSPELRKPPQRPSRVLGEQRWGELLDAQDILLDPEISRRYAHIILATLKRPLS